MAETSCPSTSLPYAEYFVRFIKAYEAEGIPIHAITPQNEPAYAPDTYPTCRWSGDQQRNFIRDHLGPAFVRHAIKTEIWCWDHYFDSTFPRAILDDPGGCQVHPRYGVSPLRRRSQSHDGASRRVS